MTLLERIGTFKGGYLFAVATVGLVALALVPFRGVLLPPAVMLMMVPAVLLVARVSGWRAAATASLAAFLVVDFTFVSPYYRLTVASPAEWIALVVFLVVALLTGQLTVELRERNRVAEWRSSELELLNRLSFRIASENSIASIAHYVVESAMHYLPVEYVALYRFADEDSGEPIAEAGQPEEDYPAFVEWVRDNGKAIGILPSDGVPIDARPTSVDAGQAVEGHVSKAVVLPLLTLQGIEAVLVVRLLRSGAQRASAVRVLVSVANLAAAALERQRLEAEASRAAASAEADRLKATLVSSVSHELKTPLAAATARVTGLLDEDGPLEVGRVREELASVGADLTRLNEAIGDLLDLSRLESDAWVPQLEPQDMSDVLGTLRSRFGADVRGRIDFRVEPDLPPVLVDFSQLVRALYNLVENALAYSDERVEVSASLSEKRVLVAVEDSGPGVPDAEKELVFSKFFRGASAAAAPGGTGLGLPITREIVQSNGGLVRVEDSALGGARFVVSLPATRWEDDR